MKKTEQQDLNFSKNYHTCFKRNKSYIPKLKIGSESLMFGSSQAFENIKGEQGLREENACENDIVFVISPLIESPNMSYLCDAFNQFL